MGVDRHKRGRDGRLPAVLGDPDEGAHRMNTRVATSVGLVGALVSALTWALGLVLVQASGGASPPEDNTYCATAAFMAIAVIFVGIVLVARGQVAQRLSFVRLRLEPELRRALGDRRIAADIQLDRRALGARMPWSSPSWLVSWSPQHAPWHPATLTSTG